MSYKLTVGTNVNMVAVQIETKGASLLVEQHPTEARRFALVLIDAANSIDHADEKKEEAIA